MVAENVDTNVVAVVYPSQLRPLKIRVGGRSRWISDKGYHVAMKRGMLQKQRLSRQRNYRTGIGRGKGGGRQRALASWEGKLERHWRMFCKTHNHHWANSAVTSAIEHGAGTIVFIQPSRGDRFLDVAGNIQPNKSGWPWYELGTLISQKGSRLGLKVKVVDELRARRCARP